MRIRPNRGICDDCGEPTIVRRKHFQYVCDKCLPMHTQHLEDDPTWTFSDIPEVREVMAEMQMVREVRDKRGNLLGRVFRAISLNG